MAFFNKIGLLVLNEDRNKFLVCEPGKNYRGSTVRQYILPGGLLPMPDEDDAEFLNAEIFKELGCKVDQKGLRFVGEYTHVSESDQQKEIMIRLYQGNLAGTPRPSTDIGSLHWVGRDDTMNQRVSPIVRNKIIPDLIAQGLLR